MISILLQKIENQKKLKKELKPKEIVRELDKYIIGQQAAKKSVDFIQRYIFPGSCIPSVAAMTGAVARATDMRLTDLKDIGPDYAVTLRCWRKNFFANLEQVRALGYPESFIRMWEFYLCYCEAGFLERVIGDVQMLLVKPQSRLLALTPPLPPPLHAAQQAP